MKKIILLGCMGICYLQTNAQQNVGIGTTTPTKGRLEVVGVAGAGATNAIFGSNSSGITLQQNWPTIGFNQYRDNTAGNGKYMASGYAVIQTMNPGTGVMIIDMLGSGAADAVTGSGTRALTFLANGNIGIKNDGGSASLTVARGTGIDGTIVLRGTTNSSHFNYGTDENTYIRAGKDGSTVFINDIANATVSVGATNGKLGINVGNPTFPLQIQQFREGVDDKGILIRSVYGDEWELRNNTTFFWILNGTTKAYINPASGNWTTVSDRRLKKDFRELPSVLDKVMQLHPLEYEMVNDPLHDGAKLGFIAQEVRPLFPALVTVFNDTTHSLGYKDFTDLHMMDYTGFGVLAIKAIQEQQQQIQILEHRMELLEGENKTLRESIKK